MNEKIRRNIRSNILYGATVCNLDCLGDYWAMLLSTAPGFIYTITNFVRDRQFNITGICILVSLLVGTVVDILSGTTERMLWNQVFVGVGFSEVFLVSMLIKKPLTLYSAMDMAYLQGYPRENNRVLFLERNFFGGSSSSH